jgi:hypothetical protein
MIRAAFPRPIDEAAFTAWLQRAGAGDRLTYWRGHLAIDASPLASRLRGEDRLRLDRVSRLAWNMAQKGWLDLLQQRHGASDFSYVAVRRRLVPALPARLAA